MNRFRRWLAASALALALPLHAAPDPKTLAPYLQEVRSADLWRGSWAVLQGEGEPITGQLGPAGANGQPADTQTRYRIGSISKLVTAVLVLQLVEQGQLRLEQPLHDFFPDRPELAGVSVEHLLRHRSGLGDVKDSPNFDDWARQPRTPAELRERIASVPRPFAPGTRAAYNNSGFLWLHALLETAGRAPFAQQLRTRISAPLGLPSLALAEPAQENSVSFTREGEAWRAVPVPTHPSVPGGAGAMVATPQDLVRFGRALAAGRLVSKPMLARMTQWQDGFGLGAMPLPQGGPLAGQGWGHEGEIDGYRAVLIVLPKQETAVAVLGNGEHLPRDAVRDELLAWATQGSAYRATAMRPAALQLVLTVDARALPLKPGERIALRGSQAPLSWQRGLPAQAGADGLHRVDLPWTGRPGLPLQMKWVVENLQGEVQRWERFPGNRSLAMGEPPTPAVFDRSPEQDALWREVLAADARLSAALAARDLPALEALFHPRLEFFHDRTGLTDYATNIASFRRGFEAPRRASRELLTRGLQIHPLPGIGAMQIGEHRFCNHVEGREPDCGTFGFSHVWERDAAWQWRLLRVMSYGH